MDLTLMELSATNAALLAYRNKLRITAKNPDLSRHDQLSAKTVLKSAEAALVKIQEQIRKQAGTYR